MHYAYFVPRNTTKLTTRGGTQSRRCGDDSHPGEEIYTPPGDEATGYMQLSKALKQATGSHLNSIR